MVYNWNTNEQQTKKINPEGYKLWRFAQMINHGLDGEKLDRQQIKKIWSQIKPKLNLDQKKTLEFFLWRKKWQKEPGLHPDRSNFWVWQQKRASSHHVSTSPGVLP